eukprot:jgi/Ulvmu1/11028/UM007_0208.1
MVCEKNWPRDEGDVWRLCEVHSNGVQVADASLVPPPVFDPPLWGVPTEIGSEFLSRWRCNAVCRTPRCLLLARRPHACHHRAPTVCMHAGCYVQSTCAAAGPPLIADSGHSGPSLSRGRCPSDDACKSCVQAMTRSVWQRCTWQAGSGASTEHSGPRAALPPQWTLRSAQSTCQLTCQLLPAPGLSHLSCHVAAAKEGARIEGDTGMGVSHVEHVGEASFGCFKLSVSAERRCMRVQRAHSQRE